MADRAQRLIKQYEATLKPRKARAAELDSGTSRTAAVFMLFSIREDRAEVLLMRRPRARGKHRGEWAFPGGMKEPDDEGLLQTAFREVEEELGIPAAAIDHWGELDPVTTVGTQFKVWPFTGRVDHQVKIVPSADEVEEIGWFPIETFTEKSMRRHIHLRRNESVRDLRAYAHNGMVIWGATARILSQVFDNPEATGNQAAGEFSEGVGN